MCWGFHKWRCVAARWYIDTSWGGQAKSTAAQFRCTKCGKIKTKNFYGDGYLTVAELNGEEAHEMFVCDKPPESWPAEIKQ